MKYYETHYEDYILSVEKYNMHPEMNKTFNKFPSKLSQLKNLIFFGPTGIGKYSQVLKMLKRYSPSELKYDKRITAVTEKQQYIYRISDIHYEVDMSLLGCNSKMVWHEVFFQIVDIILVKQDKIGVILCKNFHLIHTELLEIFYSYMQQYNYSHSNIKIIFVIITEHTSFLPEQILNCSQIIKMGRPSKDVYKQMVFFSNSFGLLRNPTEFNRSPSDCIAILRRAPNPPIDNVERAEDEVVGERMNSVVPVGSRRSYDINTNIFVKKIQYNKSMTLKNLQNTTIVNREEHSANIFDNIDTEGIINSKEIKSFAMIDDTKNIPKDIFNIICDNIIEEIINKDKLLFTGFRDILYDILTYNLDVTECIWYILQHLIQHNYLQSKDISEILIKTFPFLKYYNNNYRPIYHLESIMFYIINKIHKYDEL